MQKKKKQRALKVLGASFLCAFSFRAELVAEEKKNQLNVLLITADDLHRGSVGCFDGMPTDLTPNIDEFAKTGVRFTHAHVNCAICSPSRAILATGRYGHNSGATGFNHARENVPVVTELFKKNGGFIFSSVHNIQARVPVENILAFYETFNKFRCY